MHQTLAAARTMALWSVLFVFALIPPTWEIGEELICPKPFTDGINNITCRINKTTVDNAQCETALKTVQFDLLANSATITICSAAYNSSNCNGKQKEEDQCWCDQKDGNIFVYKYSFPLNHTTRGELQCKFCRKTGERVSNCSTNAQPASGSHVIMTTQLTVAGIALFSIFFM